MKNLIIADNQDITSMGWKYVIAQLPDQLTVNEVSKKKELIDLLVKDGNVLVILDYVFTFQKRK